VLLSPCLPCHLSPPCPRYQEYKDDDILVGSAQISANSTLVLEYRSSPDETWASETQEPEDSDEDLPATNVFENGTPTASTVNAANNGTPPLSSSNKSSYNSPATHSSPTTYSVTNRYANSGTTYSNSYYSSSRNPGETGLRNLGNTCFMNSALQCLSHCQDLSAYFLEQDWQREINADNPIGQGGKLAQAFADLLRKLWSGAHKDISPYELKDLISRVAPQFSGRRADGWC